jgi:hypothetical protein
MGLVFFFMVFSKAPKAVVWFSSWFFRKLHSYGLFFLGFFENSMALVFFFLAETSNL